MNTSFAVRLAVETPVSLRGLCHLDAILGYVLTYRGLTLNDMPLVLHHDVWQGSAAIFESGPFGANSANQLRLKHLVAEQIPDAVTEHLPSRQQRIGEMSPWRNLLTRRPLLEAVRAAWFTGLGDVDTVADLLAEVRYIGSMGATGYGKVTDLTVFEVASSSTTGLTSATGLPLRNIPLRLWHGLSTEMPASAVISSQTSRPPYWSGIEEPCICPMQTDLIATRSEISKSLVVI